MNKWCTRNLAFLIVVLARERIFFWGHYRSLHTSHEFLEEFLATGLNDLLFAAAYN